MGGGESGVQYEGLDWIKAVVKGSAPSHCSLICYKRLKTCSKAQKLFLSFGNLEKATMNVCFSEKALSHWQHASPRPLNRQIQRDAKHIIVGLVSNVTASLATDSSTDFLCCLWRRRSSVRLKTLSDLSRKLKCSCGNVTCLLMEEQRRQIYKSMM